MGPGLHTEFRIVKSLQVAIQLGFRETSPFFLTFTSVSGLLRFHPGSTKLRKNTIKSPKYKHNNHFDVLTPFLGSLQPQCWDLHVLGTGCPGCLGVGSTVPTAPISIIAVCPSWGSWGCDKAPGPYLPITPAARTESKLLLDPFFPLANTF